MSRPTHFPFGFEGENLSMPCLAMPCHALPCRRQGMAWQGMAELLVTFFCSAWSIPMTPTLFVGILFPDLEGLVIIGGEQYFLLVASVSS